MRTLICSLLGMLFLPAGLPGAGVLPEGNAPPALDVPHFPDRMHAFIWRNWPVVEVERLARVLGTSPENVTAVARSMGLPPQGRIAPAWKTRGYITIVRRNWHLLPYDQLLLLLDRSAEELAYLLREDDFLFIKLGNHKPACPPLRYSPPDAQVRARAEEIRRIVQDTCGAELSGPQEPRFAFVEQLSRPTNDPAPVRAKKQDTGPRYLYSYFALYGDPLSNPELDPYPDGLLQRLSAVGVNGIWLHTVLRTLAPSPTFPEFGKGHEARLAALRRLVDRARRYGIDVYLYVNEPRAMPEAFFQRPGRNEMKGVREGDHLAMCTSAPEVRQWLTEALAHVFRQVPNLGGVFTITASENLTHCAAHGHKDQCPRCRQRGAAEIIAEVNSAIEAGVHRGNPAAKVIAWDWGWPDEEAPQIIARLPRSVWLQSVSEWSLPIRRGGVESTVGEYGLSVVGPGPRAVRHWELARQAGLKTSAKVQFNITWELSAVPYLPVLDLVAQHAGALARCKVDGMMLSWSLGGYPSPNLEVAQAFADDPNASRDQVLDRIAQAHYGAGGAASARKAWSRFSTAFTEFPFHVAVLYFAPTQYGPANLLYATPTRYASTMVGFPYDDLDGWRGPYPANVFAGQFGKVAEGWRGGLEDLRQAVAVAPADRKAGAEAELRLATAAGLHFASVANQARFTSIRNRLLRSPAPPSKEERKELMVQLCQLAEDEERIAVQLWRLARADSRIGYEASNQYYYLPEDLMEKVLNCREIVNRLRHLLAKSC